MNLYSNLYASQEHPLYTLTNDIKLLEKINYLINVIANYVFYYECVKVPMADHQVFPWTAYMFQTSYNTSVTQANKI